VSPVEFTKSVAYHYNATGITSQYQRIVFTHDAGRTWRIQYTSLKRPDHRRGSTAAAPHVGTACSSSSVTGVS
jgi:hypothetical protein